MHKKELLNWLEETAYGEMLYKLKSAWDKHKSLIKKELIISELVCWFLGGEIVNLGNKEKTFLTVLANGIGIGNVGGLIFNVILWGLINYLVLKFFVLSTKDYVYDKERGLKKSKNKDVGDNDLIAENSKEELDTFIKGNISEIKDIIVGEKNGNLYQKIRRSNGNYIIFGTPGAGKSVGFVLSTIMQKIRMGESLIITDPKGELYEETSAMAKAHNAKVYMFSTNPMYMTNSDSCNLMKALKGANNSIAVQFVQAIMDNTSNGKSNNEDYWTKQERNLLTGLVLMLAHSKMFECTLEELEMLTAKSAEELLDIMSKEVPPSASYHPAKRYIDIFRNQDKQQKDILGGLGVRLGFLGDPLVKLICSKDDIDIESIGTEQTIIYVGCSDQDTSLSVVLAMFFTVLFQTLVPFADSQPDKKLPVKLTFLLDEFKNIGKIPSFPEKLSTVRSRMMDTIMILQGLEQLTLMYPNNEHETILNDCEMQILLKCNSKMTAEYFSWRSGTMGVVVNQKKYDDAKLDMLKIKSHYNSGEDVKARQVLTVGEVLTFGKEPDDHRILVAPLDHNMIMLNNYFYKKHPMYQEIHTVKVQDHTGKWLREMDERTREVELGITTKFKDEFDASAIEIVPEGEYLDYDMAKYLKELSAAYKDMDLPTNSKGEKIEVKFAARQGTIGSQRVATGL